MGEQGPHADGGKGLVGVAVALKLREEVVVNREGNAETQLEGDLFEEGRVTALLVTVVEVQQNRVLVGKAVHQFGNSLARRERQRTFVGEQDGEDPLETELQTILHVLALQRP